MKVFYSSIVGFEVLKTCLETGSLKYSFEGSIVTIQWTLLLAFDFEFHSMEEV